MHISNRIYPGSPSFQGKYPSRRGEGGVGTVGASACLRPPPSAGWASLTCPRHVGRKRFAYGRPPSPYRLEILYPARTPDLSRDIPFLVLPPQRSGGERV